MKKIALTILTATFVIGLFSIDTTTAKPKANDTNNAETSFRYRILGQAGQITNPDFNFKKEAPLTNSNVTESIPGREELLKLSDEIRQKTEKIKNLKFNPEFIKDEKFKNLVELVINLEEPSPVGLKNPFLDFKFRNQVTPTKLKSNAKKLDGSGKLVTTNESTIGVDPLLSFAQCIAKSKAILYIADDSEISDDQLALFEDYDTELNYVNCTNDNPTTSTKMPYLKACTDKKITAFPTWTFPKTKNVVGLKDLKYIAKATGCVLKVK